MPTVCGQMAQWWEQNPQPLFLWSKQRWVWITSVEAIKTNSTYVVKTNVQRNYEVAIKGNSLVLPIRATVEAQQKCWIHSLHRQRTEVVFYVHVLQLTSANEVFLNANDLTETFTGDCSWILCSQKCTCGIWTKMNICLVLIHSALDWRNGEHFKHTELMA